MIELSRYAQRSLLASLIGTLALAGCGSDESSPNPGTDVLPGTSISGTAAPAPAGTAAAGRGTTGASGTSSTGTTQGGAGRVGAPGASGSSAAGTAAAGTAAAAGSGGESAGTSGSAGSGGAGGEDDADGGVGEAGSGGRSAGGSGGTPAAGRGGAGGAGGALAAGRGGAGGASAGRGGAGGTSPTNEDLGEGNGRDVITIGDSWMSNTLLTGDGIEGALQRLTRQPYRNYGVQGVELLRDNTFGRAVPTQYDAAKRADPEIMTVVMTGGGNDIIQNPDPAMAESCREGTDLCRQLLMTIRARLGELWTSMATDGVKDVVLIRYSDDAGDTADELRDIAKEPPEICLSGRIRCHAIETTAVVMGDLQDGIHPTQAANDRIATVVYNYLVEQGIRR